MRRLAWFSAGFCAAALVFSLSLPWMIAVFLTAPAVILTLVPRTRPVGRRFAVLALGFTLGLGWCGLDWARNIRPLEALDGSARYVEAVAREASRKTAYGTSTTVELSIDGRDCRALLYGESSLVLRPGDRVSGKMRLRRTGAKFGDEDLYYGARGIGLRLYPADKPSISRPEVLPLRFYPAAFSMKLKESLPLPDRERGFAIALLTGDRSGLSDDFYDDMALAGTRHIVAVSGMHIGILTGALLLLIRNKRLAAFLGLPLLVFFGLCVGLSASVVRALVMQGFLLLAPVFWRENDPPTSLFAALTLILLPNPRAILDVGLQLSFGATAGILLFSRRVFDRLWNEKHKKWLGKLPCLRTLLAGVTASVSVIPLTLPLQLLYFEQFSLVGPLSSAVLVPLLPLVFTLGLLTALFSIVCFPLGSALACPLTWLIRISMRLTTAIAKLPFAAVSSRSFYLLVFLLALYTAAVYLMLDKRPCNPWVSLSCLAGLFALCLYLNATGTGTGSVTVLDVGQGQCVCFQSGGHAALYDCGGSKDAAEIAAQFLQSSGKRKVDFLVLSHYDSDHCNGVLRLLRRVKVGAIYLPQTPDENGTQAAILDAAQSSGVPTRFVNEDLRFDFGDGSIYVYAPVHPGEGNDACVAARFATGDFDVLLTGDMDASAENELIQDFEPVDVLVAGHHGAASSTGTAALDVLEPRCVLISAGKGNSYGHPAKETLKRLKNAGIAVYRTDQCGSITVWR